MDEVSYNKDDSIDMDVPRIEVADKLLRYEDLTPRHFEVLVFLTYKNEIEFGCWKGKYDDISLMQFVKDKGRDCSLTKENKNAGVIQCKNYTDVLAKRDCVKEIIKFLIYYTLNNALIYDIRDFTYYVIAPKGFSNDATDLINDFNRLIGAEQDLDNWIDQVQKANASFKGLSLVDIRNKIKALLAVLQVKKIDGPELDMTLEQPVNLAVKKKFFKYPGQDKLDEMAADIEQIKKIVTTTPYSAHSVDDILSNIQSASFALFDYSNTFSTDREIHVVRGITDEIFQWIKTPLETSEKVWNVALLSGEAGAGKSVVMRDLCDKLKSNNIPVLGIKADLYQAADLNSLQNKLNLKDPVDSLAKKLGEKYALVIVCIDQIDALSQSLSADRNYITSFNNMVSSLRLLSNVRVIISTRAYDLAYDPSLRYYKKQKIFKLEKLSVDEVKTVLIQESIPVPQLSASLMELIRNPNELNVFLKVYRSDSKLESFQTIYDLYNELWQQKVLNTDTKKLLFDIATRMYQQQTINIPEIAIQEHDSSIVNYTKSTQLIRASDGKLQFFHQSFYDYVFARYFSEVGKNLDDYIIENNSGLFVRASVKMILAFQSAIEHTRYIQTVRQILFTEKHRFHIRLLVTQFLASRQEPTTFEKQLVRELEQYSSLSFSLFIESVNSPLWLSLLITEGYLDKLFTAGNDLNLPYYLLIRHFPGARKMILEYLEKMPVVEEGNNFPFRVMLNLQQLDTEPGFKMITQNKAELKKDYFSYFMYLEHALPYNPTWASDLITEFILEAAKDKNFLNHNQNAWQGYQHQIGSLYQQMINTDSIIAFNKGLQIVNFCIAQTSYEHVHKFGAFYSDQSFENIDDDENHNDGYEKIYFLLDRLAGSIALTEKQVFLDFYHANKNSNSISLLHLIFSGFQQNPVGLIDETVDFFEVLFSKNLLLDYAPKIDKDLKKLIMTSYSFLPFAFQEKINQLLLSISPQSEIGYTDQHGKKIFQGGRGYGNLQYSFLVCIPENQRIKYPLVNKRYQELKRKFPNFREPRRGVYFSRNNEDIPAGKLKRFTQEAWVNTFKSRKKTSTTLARSFKDEVKQHAEKFYPIINHLVTDENITNEYIINGIQGLIEVNYDAKALWVIIKELLKRKLEQFDVLQIIWFTSYLRKHDIKENELLAFLQTEALNNSDPAEDKDASLQTGFNTVRGAAINELILFCTYQPWQDKIIEVAKAAALDKISCVRACCLHHIAFLSNADKETALQIFLTITNGNNDFIETGAWSARYLSHYNFEAIFPFLEKMIAGDENTMEYAVAVLCHRYAQSYPGSEELLERAFANCSKAKAAAIRTAKYNLIADSGELQQRYVSLYTRFFAGPIKDELEQAYGTSFLHLQPADIKTLYPILEEFVLSVYGKQSVSYFYEYLYKASRFFPVECLDLLLLVQDFSNVNVQMRVREDNPVNVVISAYNKLYQQNPLHPKTIIALDIFDKLLEKPQYRKELDAVLEKVEK